MSNIYISEPHTNGKVVLNTTSGEIEIELWSKEAPMACKNFIQLCMEGYYDHSIFHRVVKKFIIQGGDPTGTGDGGESIYGEPFKMEIHSRLRFNRRGLVAMSCSNNKVDGSQFFFTLKETPELQGNHVIFGHVVGDTIYNMINLAEGLIDKGTERPLHPKEIISCNIILNPFNDIIPRQKETPVKVDDTPKSQMAAIIDYGLLSFGDDAEDDEEDISTEIKCKGKSAHDHSKYSNLSSETIKIDPSEERAVVGKIDLAPVIIEKPKEKKEDKEKMDKLREETRLLEQQIITEIIKEREPEDKKEQKEENSQVLPKAPKSFDRLDVLKIFSQKIKSSTSSDWFYKPITLGDTDDIETKVYDPDVYNPEKYDLFDPRNPLNQRKRQADEPIATSKPKGKKTE